MKCKEPKKKLQSWPFYRPTTILRAGCLMRLAQLIRMRFESTVRLDHSLEVLLAPMSDGCTTATSGQSVNHTLCPDLVGFQTLTAAAVTCIRGIALNPGKAHAERNHGCE